MAPVPSRHAVALTALLLLGCAGSAPPPSSLPDPTHANAAVPPLRHTGVLPRSAPLPEVGDWAEANRNVDRIGGWRSYAREAAAAASAPASAPASGAGR